MMGSKKSARDKTKAGIVSLIKALHEHRKFKRMCVYSLKAILKSLMPPNTDWERNILLFCENGGIKGVVKILERYPGDGDILEDCTAILAQVPKPRPQGPSLCWQLAKDGAIVDTLKSMAKNSHLEKGVRNAMDMVENVSKCNARAFVSNPENLDGVFEIVDIFPGRPDVVCPASHTYEAVCRRKKTARVFVERGGLPRLIKMLNCKGSDADAVRAQFNALRKLVGYDIKYIEMVNQCDGLQNVVAALAAFPDDPSIQLIGSKIINEVAGENIERLVTSVRRPRFKHFPRLLILTHSNTHRYPRAPLQLQRESTIFSFSRRWHSRRRMRKRFWTWTVCRSVSICWKTKMRLRK